MTNTDSPLPLTILLVDDSGTIRHYARSILEKIKGGCAVVECENGAHALQWLSSLVSEEFPDLIIMDRNMPQMSGDECLRILKMDNDWQNIPVLFLTAQSDYDHVYAAKNALGVDGYICKPFEPGELLAQVHRLAGITVDELEASQDRKPGMKELPTTPTESTDRQTIDESMLSLFLVESKELTEKIQSGLDAAKAGGADINTWRSIAYCAHTIKGSAGIVGLETHSRLGKSLEDYGQKAGQQPNLFQDTHLEPLEEAVLLLTNLAETEPTQAYQLESRHHDRIIELESVLDQLVSAADTGISDEVELQATDLPKSSQDSYAISDSDLSVNEHSAKSGAHATTVDPKGIVVLLIDDQKLVGETVRRMLIDESNIKFHFCKNPLDAIETALDIRPTVILQDLVMPQLDGLELVRHFRAQPTLRDIPLIVLSGTEDAKTKAKAFALGANDYMVKLPDAVEVIARIRYHSRGYLNLLEREAHLARITWLAEHDPLTGCLNRRTWYDRLVQAAGVTPYEHNLAVAICDIDFFKKVNDTYGHLCGDEALKHFVGILKERLDNLGTLGRLGGEEFGIFMVLPTSMHQTTKPLEEASGMLEKLRQSIEDAPLKWEAHTVNLTMSVGLALHKGDDSTEVTLSRADTGVYQAKDSGRNQVVAIA